jgi:hypothetical protein
VAQDRSGGPTIPWHWQTPAGAHNCHGTLLSVDFSALIPHSVPKSVIKFSNSLLMCRSFRELLQNMQARSYRAVRKCLPSALDPTTHASLWRFTMQPSFLPSLP